MTKMSIRNVEAAFAAVLLAFAPPASAQETCPPPGATTHVDDRAMAHIRYLADDRLEGREVGTRGARRAADYIAAQFRGLGLEPAVYKRAGELLEQEVSRRFFGDDTAEELDTWNLEDDPKAPTDETQH